MTAAISMHTLMPLCLEHVQMMEAVATKQGSVPLCQSSIPMVSSLTWLPLLSSTAPTTMAQLRLIVPTLAQEEWMVEDLIGPNPSASTTGPTLGLNTSMCTDSM